MITQEQALKVNEIVEKHNFNKSALISILQDIQDAYRYLPEDILMHVSEIMDISTAKVFGVATFYENFSLEPKGKYVIRICDGTACHVRKSIPVLKALQKALNLSDEKNTTADLLFTLETVSCLGACGLAPVITINNQVYGKITPEQAVTIINEIKEEEKK
ncbi:NAD(P)H-dependent oxidoreductase subunit E [Clostridiaceae bacterium 35-E11]